MPAGALPYQSDGDIIFYRTREATASVSPQARVLRRWGPELFVSLAWRDRLFIFLSNLALDATEFFRIPPNRVMELGGQIEI